LPDIKRSFNQMADNVGSFHSLIAQNSILDQFSGELLGESVILIIFFGDLYHGDLARNRIRNWFNN